MEEDQHHFGVKKIFSLRTREKPRVGLMDMNNLSALKAIKFRRRSNAIGSDVLGIQKVSDIQIPRKFDG
jgi:hypothetical protein